MKVKIFTSSDLDWEPQLKLIHIYIDTPAFDEITQDTSAKIVDKLSNIGGTLGLLTGFSLVSAVEFLYFISKFLWNWQAQAKEKKLMKKKDSNV